MLRGELLAGLVLQVRRVLEHRDRCLVAVDGADGAGKTRFAADLVSTLDRHGVVAAGASVDGFHRPRAQRWARGRRSPEGYWRDSFDYDALRCELVDPWRVGGRYRTAVHDVASDHVLDLPAVQVPVTGALVVDGVFLLRDELAGLWDLRVRLEVGATERFRRMSLRDGCPADPQHPDNRRYLVAHQLYEEACEPAGRADLVFDATHPADLRVLSSRVHLVGGDGALPAVPPVG